jgi:Tfp pilus assembly protein PilE
MTDLGYTNAGSFETPDGWYDVSAAACGGGLAQCVELTATAQDDQANDRCENFVLDSRGQRSVSGSGNCW